KEQLEDRLGPSPALAPIVLSRRIELTPGHPAASRIGARIAGLARIPRPAGAKDELVGRALDACHHHPVVLPSPGGDLLAFPMRLNADHRVVVEVEDGDLLHFLRAHGARRDAAGE